MAATALAATFNTPVFELQSAPTERILVIEHDGALRKIVGRLFCSEGYEVDGSMWFPIPTKISSSAAGDFFKLNDNDTYDFIYDRASLVAMPFPMRKSYAQVIRQSLKKGGKYLLIVYEYDQSKLYGPSLSIDDNEIHELYEDQFTITLMETKQPTKEGPGLSSLESLNRKSTFLKGYVRRQFSKTDSWLD
jgi:hypothetical protein